MEYFYIYILKCSDGSYYTGHTDNFEKRIAQHKEGNGDGYVAARLPVEPVFVELFASRAEVLEAEFKIKRWTRKKKEVLIKYGWKGMKSFKKKHL